MSATAEIMDATRDIKAYMQQCGQQARAAARQLISADSGRKNAALLALADALIREQASLLAANQQDLQAGEAAGLDAALQDRLALDAARVQAMADGVRQVAELPDPIGEITELRPRPSGIKVGRMRTPLGVVGIIYESRPNVTADAAALCLKSGNACILRGGSEAWHSNQAIAACIRTALKQAGLPELAVQVVQTADRAAVGELLTMPEYVDVVIPRGGQSLVKFVAEHARVPVIKHLDGICHVYIGAAADLDKALRIAENAKTQRYGTCNTMECLLVHQQVAATYLPALAERLRPHQVEVRACERAQPLMPGAIAASDDDWGREYLAPILALRVVDDMDMAFAHIDRYSSQHTDCIVTENWTAANQFLQRVDSSSVMVNASTRFADGFEYGLGAEIGISTDKFHARGPVGLEGLTSLKWVVLGDGQIR